jgi:ribosomal subunit interface protein
VNFKISARHFEPPEELKSDIEEKVMAAVQKHYKNAIGAEFVILMDNSRYDCELDVSIKGKSFHAKNEDYNLHDCIEKTIKKIDTQLRRNKDKKVSAKKNNGGFNENS